MKPLTTSLSHKNMAHDRHADCPLCRSSKQTFYRKADNYRIVRCDQCQFLFVSPLPSQEALATFYQQPAYYEGSDLGYDDYLGDRHRHEQLARGRLHRIENMHPSRGDILDVGCAAGFFCLSHNRVVGKLQVWNYRVQWPIMQPGYSVTRLHQHSTM